MPDFYFEQQHGWNNGRLVAGFDEAGRGPWAGPVVAAAVAFDFTGPGPDWLTSLNDSKKLSVAKREKLYDLITQSPDLIWALGEASVEEIDRLNILQASLLAMRRAYQALSRGPTVALIDGNKKAGLDCQEVTLVKGDGRSYSIAAASILAKVRRDQIMAELAIDYPAFAWQSNAGYGTAAHQKALKQFGPSPHHRRSFKPIQALLSNDS